MVDPEGQARSPWHPGLILYGRLDGAERLATLSATTVGVETLPD